MDKIKHVAIFTPDPAATAKFYQDVFDLEVAGPAGTGFYLTDGHINLAILQARKDEEGNPIYTGIDHFGFKVDDVEDTQKKLATAGAGELPSHAPPGGGAFYYELKYQGPNKQTIDVSGNGWVGTD
jgi:catechol 2,3-dioxygenase-like lactoylglutathione lyase family enzyme